MKQKDLERQFLLIVKTLLSGDTKPEIIREHLNQYAKNAGTSYDLARQAVIWKAQHILNQKTAQLF